MNDLFLEALNSGNTSVSNLLLDNYQKLGMSNDEFLVYLQLQKESGRGNKFPEMHKVAQSIGFQDTDFYTILHSLETKKFLAVEANSYNFQMLYQKLSKLLEEQHTKEQNQHTENKTEELFNNIQQEFGRMLSPIEIEMINQWLKDDGYSSDLIQMALKEAVLNQAYSLKYMDRILLSWEKKNIKTPQQVQENLGVTRQKQQSSQTNNFVETRSKPKIPITKLTNKN
ncbi:DnaD domain protein [Pediococcus argentinicus]|uniref:DnaD domain-containing protein n=1 Tax=Pediococcus argentinicus TaxID=480391 RepID=UPI00338F947B